jgi:hypothetical protein
MIAKDEMLSDMSDEPEDADFSNFVPVSQYNVENLNQ